MTEPVPTQRAIAEHTLRSVEAWRPSLNIRQLRQYLAAGHPSTVRSSGL